MYSERGSGAGGGTGSGSGSGPSGGVDSGGGGGAAVRSRGARRDLSENVNRDAESEIMDLLPLLPKSQKEICIRVKGYNTCAVNMVKMEQNWNVRISSALN